MSTKKKSLDDAEMVTERRLGRRSSMARLGAGILGAVGLVNGIAPAEAHANCNDSDSGPNADPSGRGRSCGSSGCTDSDRGPNQDGAGRGRSCRRSCSDSDSGPNADGAGRGRSC